ncbi:MAG: HPr-rel-A system PqqD family peptide chaperone [Methylomicrobium sp.]|nr:HPr-rel-A system PqqD family peptide chaperone [Methylomicrobium sp.]
MTELVWKIPESLILCIAEWDDQIIVYHSLSGETHYLNDFAAEALKLIQLGPFTLNSLVEDALKIFEVEDKKELEQPIKQIINQFESLGFVEPLNREN